MAAKQNTPTLVRGVLQKLKVRIGQSGNLNMEEAYGSNSISYTLRDYNASSATFQMVGTHGKYEIEKQGFMVESNPSSNLRIGDMDSYIKHPIFKFYTTPNLLKLDFTHNISVSINTDDKGIFNTSLEREYALLAAAYSKEHTTKQEQSDLFEWLDSIRKMGLEQSFVPTNQ